MNKKQRSFFRGIAIFAALALNSCGGGEQIASSGGTGGTGISMGTVTGFGSVFVNGVEYDTTGAQVLVDGAPDAGGQNALDLGMVVTIRGTIHSDGKTGAAQIIEYKKRIVGPVQAVPDLINQTVRVLGQQVQVKTSTRFSSDTAKTVTGIADLEPDDRVEISGLSTVGGRLEATRIHVVPSAKSAVVKGLVSGVESGAFNIGPWLKVEYGDFPPAFTPRVSDFVEVVGIIKVDGGASGVTTMTATQPPLLSSEGITDLLEGDQIEIEGIVAEATDTYVTVNGQRIHITSATQLNGITVVQDAVGTRVEIEGYVVANEIVAASIAAKRESSVEIKANVLAKDESASTIILLGRTVKITPLTAINDKAGFFSNINTVSGDSKGTFLSVHGYPSESEIIATEIEIISDSSYELEGRADADSYTTGSTQFKIAGITVDASEAAISGAPNLDSILLGKVSVVGKVASPYSTVLIATDIEPDL